MIRRITPACAGRPAATHSPSVGYGTNNAMAFRMLCVANRRWWARVLRYKLELDCMKNERENLIESFLRHQPGVSDEEFDSIDELDEIVKNDPVEALKIVQELLRRAASDDARSYIAAGPLENLVRHSSDEFFHTIEVAAEHDLPLRRALSEVWVGEEVSAHIRSRLAALADQE